MTKRRWIKKEYAYTYLITFKCGSYYFGKFGKTPNTDFERYIRTKLKTKSFSKYEFDKVYVLKKYDMISYAGFAEAMLILEYVWHKQDKKCINMLLDTKITLTHLDKTQFSDALINCKTNIIEEEKYK